MQRRVDPRQFRRAFLPRDILVRTTAITAAALVLALALHDLGSDPAGHALQVSVVNALMLQLPLYLSALMVQTAVWAIAAVVWPQARRAIDGVGVTGALLVVLLVQVDLGMQRFRGERLALAHVQLYGTGDMVNSDWIRPVLEMPVALALWLLLLLGSLLLLLLPWVRGGIVRERLTGHVPVACVLLAFAGQLPGRLAYDHQRVLALAPQEVLLREWFRRPVPLSATDEREARDALRRMVDPLGRGGWLSDTFPLWRRSDYSTVPGAGAARQNPPDIILFTVESLRGRDVGWGFAPRPAGHSVTPHLDSLAHESVTFPHWIAAGEPSPRGFVTLHNGAWEHGSGFLIANFPEKAVESLPQRLRAMGYRTMAIWGGNPSFDNQLTWARRWYDDLDFELPGNQLFYFRTRPDRLVMDRFLHMVAHHDTTHAGTPFFAYVAPNGTHTPYTLDEAEAMRTPALDGATMTRQQRYDRVLRNADAQIGRVVAALRARPRWRNTVIIVVGDHADRTDEPADRLWTGMPTDALVATAGLIYGPPSLTGLPRIANIPVSHTDLLPTVLAWLGDTNPVATLGRSVFDTAAVGSRDAVSINSRGVRLDRGQYSLLVATDDPGMVRAWNAFTGEQPTPLSLAQTPFAPDEPRRVLQRVRYWSYLIEQNRVRPPH